MEILLELGASVSACPAIAAGEDEAKAPMTLGILDCSCVILWGPAAPACGSRLRRHVAAGYGSDRRLKRLRLVRETKMEWPDSVRGRPDPILFGAPAGTGLYDGSVIFNMLAKVRESKSAPLPTAMKRPPL